MKTQTLDYKHDGVTCRGYLAMPDGSGRHPGVLIFHEAPGCDDHVKRRAGMLAELGYVALAVDMYGDGKVASSGPQALEMMNVIKNDGPKFLGRLHAGYDALVAQPSVNSQQLAAIGYCFGGYCVLELARSGAQLAGAVTFHGLLETQNPAVAGKVKPKILVCTGAEDPLVPAPQVLGFEQEMTKAGVDWQVITYSGAKHAFTNTAADQIPMPGFGYQPAADRRSWAAMRGLFSEVFG
jgi:dienelactone hydrolase